MKKIYFILAFFLTNLAYTFGQEPTGVEMAFSLRSSGKIYVVVAAIAIVFIGLAIYLFSIDKKIKRLERNA